METDRRAGSRAPSHTARLGPLLLIALFLCASPLDADEIQLKTGDRIIGTIIEQDEDHLIMTHPVLGRLEIPRAQIELISVEADDEAAEPPAETAAKEFAAEAQADAPPDKPAAPAAEAPKESEWEFSLVLGLSARAGNTDSQTFNAAFTASRETPAVRTHFNAAYYLDISDGDTTDNNFTAGARHDWLLPKSRWFYFAQGRYDFDDFQSWQHRVSAHGGVGYHLVQTDDFRFKLRGGIGGVKEWGSDDQDLRPEGLFSTGIVWQLTDRQKFTAESTLFPHLDDLSEFRVLTNGQWSLLLDEENRLSLNLSLQHEYESMVDPGDDRNDF
ncbi:MAG: DUF481 domain-containing protein, partial [Planctomycetota bacterium]